MSNKIQISIYSHDGDYIDLLFDSDREFEGQIYAPQITVNANGQKQLSLSMPLRIMSKDKSGYIDNPRWEYITKQYKVRVNDDGDINEFVLNDYSESHSDSDQLTVDANFISLAEFELGQIGYDVVFSAEVLNKYEEGQDPNDPDNLPIGTYDSDIHFWEQKLLENVPGWDYRVESYYEVDEDMPIDNRQFKDTTLEIPTGKEQFYEKDRIINYDNNNDPVKSDKYEIKQRIMTEEKSNIWNIQQDICEKFECWPTFEILYNETGDIVSKTIVLKNDLPDDALFTIHYKKNLKNIQRTVDNSQIVTKMYVNDLENENVNEGVVSISTNDKNFMKENYLLDFSWFLGENTTNKDLNSENLINPNLKMTFNATNYAIPNISTKTISNTKEIIEEYKKNIRYRNTYIENKSLELGKMREQLTELKAELEYKISSRDAAQEQYNRIKDEWLLCPQDIQTKKDKKCYIYTEDGVRIVKFSEVGIRENDIPTIFSNPINLLFLNGNPVTKDNVNQIQWSPYERDEVIGTITKMQVLNVMLGEEQSYGCFSCDLSYYPLEFYEKLKRYWLMKVNENLARIAELGRPKNEGGIIGIIPELEDKIEETKLDLFNAQKEKKETIIEFESLLFPYVREGYWEDTDYGIYSNKVLNEEGIYPIEEPLYNEILQKVDWTQNYFCFYLPNDKIGSYNIDGISKDIYLYDVIDISNLEVMTTEPGKENNKGSFKTYVNGTDYEVQYGYTTYDINNNTYKRGIYVTFYQLLTTTATGIGISKDTKLYIRAKARGSNDYIMAKYISPEFNNGRPYFAEMSRYLTITEKDVILSSIKVNFITGLINAPQIGATTIEQSIVPLIYGIDFYTYKDLDEEGKTITKIYLNNTVNCPIRTDGTNTWFNVDYEQDVTGKFYFNSALETMAESCLPQVTYSVTVLDISNILNPNLNIEYFKPKIGTRIPIYDEELHFYGMSGFINSITYNLLEPENTILTITNFKDKFEDLFQKITAATIAVQSKEHLYDQATEITDEKGTIKVDLLMNSLMQNNLALALSPNNDVVWDNSGITVTNKELNKNGVYGKLKITSNGVFISNKYDEYGNYAWTTAITPDFINADAITVGKLDTRQIQIFNSSEPRFTWNESGLYAYSENNEGYTDYNAYVLYNHNGLTFRELGKYTRQAIITNLFTTQFKDSYTNWDYENATLETETINGKTTDFIRLSGLNTNIVECTISNGTIGILNREHKYYYRIKVRFNSIPNSSLIDFHAGFTGRLQEYDFEKIQNKTEINDKISSEWIILSGFAENIDPNGKFGIIGALSQYASDWSIDMADPIIVDITKIFGNSEPSKNYLDTISYFIGEKTIENFDIYQNSLSLGWKGLVIGAQGDVLQLNSEDGLVVYQPISDSTNEKKLKLQLGTWVDSNGENKYGLRGLDKNGNTFFEVSQVGFKVKYGNTNSTIDEIIDKTIAYTVIIQSSNGNVFKNRNIDTVLKAVVMKGQEEITSELPNSSFVWTRVSNNTAGDEVWNNAHVGVGSTINITQGDVDSQAVFNCSIQV